MHNKKIKFMLILSFVFIILTIAVNAEILGCIVNVDSPVHEPLEIHEDWDLKSPEFAVVNRYLFFHNLSIQPFSLPFVSTAEKEKIIWNYELWNLTEEYIMLNPTESNDGVLLRNEEYIENEHLAEPNKNLTTTIIQSIFQSSINNSNEIYLEKFYISNPIDYVSDDLFFKIVVRYFNINSQIYFPFDNYLFSRVVPHMSVDLFYSGTLKSSNLLSISIINDTIAEGSMNAKGECYDDNNKKVTNLVAELNVYSLSTGTFEQQQILIKKTPLRGNEYIDYSKHDWVIKYANITKDLNVKNIKVSRLPIIKNIFWLSVILLIVITSYFLKNMNSKTYSDYFIACLSIFAFQEGFLLLGSGRPNFLVLYDLTILIPAIGSAIWFKIFKKKEGEYKQEAIQLTGKEKVRYDRFILFIEGKAKIKKIAEKTITKIKSFIDKP